MTLSQMFHLVEVAGPHMIEECHRIREAALFAGKPHKGPYNRNHPDDRNPNNRFMALLNNRHKVVGTCRLDLKPANTAAIIRLVAVDEEWRGLGAGRKMMLEVFDILLTEGIRIAHLNAAPTAITFYERLGFKRHNWNLHDPGKSREAVQMTITLG